MRPMNGCARACTVAATLAMAYLAACHRTSSASGTVADSTASDSASAASSAATPVTMAQVARRTLDVTVNGPGVIDAAEDERVRAPFEGVLTALTPHVGDHVAAGEVIGRMVALNSEAAWRGAHQMEAAARTAAERAEAKRAVEVAEANLVQMPIAAPRAGVVIAQSSAAGERLAQGDSIVSIAVTGQIVFFADIAQQDLAAVHGGETARVALNARPGWVAGTVHTVLPSDTGQMASMRVRIDLPASAPVTVGLFGMATVVTAEHANALVVPAQALVRDDITGVTKIALVDAHDIAHWTVVTPGIVDSAWAEILRPALSAGQRVITSGAVGLPDSTRVVAVPDTTAGSGGRSGSPTGAAGARPGKP